MTKKRVSVLKVTIKAAFAVDLKDSASVLKAAKAFEDLKTVANDAGFSIEDQSSTFGNMEVEG